MCLGQLDDELTKMAERLGDAMQEKVLCRLHQCNDCGSLTVLLVARSQADLAAENKRLTLSINKWSGDKDELMRRVTRLPCDARRRQPDPSHWLQAIEAEKKLETMKGQVTFKKM